MSIAASMCSNYRELNIINVRTLKHTTKLVPIKNNNNNNYKIVSH